MPEVAFAGCVQYRACAQEQETLHERVVHRVVHHGNQRERGGGPHVDAREYDRKPEAGEHDSDVLDRGVGEQTLHIGLRGREHDPVQGAEQPEGQRQQAPPPHRLAQKIETHANHCVQRGLEHDAAHQRGHGRGRRGMCLGSHTCSGTRPALAPKPRSARQKATAAQPGARCAARMASNVNCQVPPCRTPKLSKIAIAPR